MPRLRVEGLFRRSAKNWIMSRWRGKTPSHLRELYSLVTARAVDTLGRTEWSLRKTMRVLQLTYSLASAGIASGALIMDLTMSAPQLDTITSRACRIVLIGRKSLQRLFVGTTSEVFDLCRSTVTRRMNLSVGCRNFRANKYWMPNKTALPITLMAVLSFLGQT